MKIIIAISVPFDRGVGCLDQMDAAEVLCSAASMAGISAIPLLVGATPDQVREKLTAYPDHLVLNQVTGNEGNGCEAWFTALLENEGFPYTGSGVQVASVCMDVFACRKVLESSGVECIPTRLLELMTDSRNTGQYPVEIVNRYYRKLNGENLIVQTGDELNRFIRKKKASGNESYIIQEINSGELRVFYFRVGESEKTRVFGDFSDSEEEKLTTVTKKAFRILGAKDYAEVIFRRDQYGSPCLYRFNPFPLLHVYLEDAELADAIYLLAYSGIKGKSISRKKASVRVVKPGKPRRTARELGIVIGRFKPGRYNAITDVRGVKVGHITCIEDDVEIPVTGETGAIRTGVTAILPSDDNIYEHPLAAGGYILNGVGEMTGMFQVQEWGLIETPIVLTNTMSVGVAHSGVISYMTEKHSGNGTDSDVIIPVVGETDDSFLNDVRIRRLTSYDTVMALKRAKSGPVIQGNVGAGTGMTTCDFAGGIGSSSRIVNVGEKSYTLGVLVLSNFGVMKNLTLCGAVIGKTLDIEYDRERRRSCYGSIIVVVATDAPMISQQLSQISKRAALGLGRAGSYAATSSGEIIIAFSTGNRFYRRERGKQKFLTMKFLSNKHLDTFYEAAVETTEEAIANAMCCSNSMTGRLGRCSPALPHEKLVEFFT